MKSTVGLRVSWTCGKCITRAATHQIAIAGTVTPELPTRWTVEAGLTLCGGCSDEYSSHGQRPALDTQEFRAA